MYKKLLVLFLFLLNVSFASAALSWAEWTANHNTDITITNGQLSEFEWTVQAVSNFQGVQGRYSIWLFRNGNNNPIRTYFYNQPTINNGAGGYINVTPSDYQNLVGDYQVKVYSVDYFGADIHVINLHVIPAVPPLTITCSANPTQGQAPLTTTYIATANGGTGVYASYFWNFDDGQVQTTSSNTLSHTYEYSGSYDGTVRVTDSQGNTATASCPTITVTAPTPLTATCNAQPTSGFKPLTVNFTGTATGGSGTYYYQWTYGDGQVQNGNNKITHIYNQAGAFYPTLKVTDTNNNAVVVNCPTIHVNNYQPIIGTCTAMPTNGTRPLTVQFQVTAQGGSGTYNAYGWDFLGNNQLNTQGSTATYVYQNAGTYNPDVTVYDNQGNQGIISCPTITVNNPIPPLTATCNAYPTSGFKPLTVNFTGTATGGSGTYYYYWYFDDGYSQYGQNRITHKYNNAGIYHPTLKVTDTQNNIITVNCPTINVNNYPAITGTCHAEPNNGYAPLTTELTVIVNGGSGTYTNYTWTFNDGTSQNTIINNVFHTYQNPGHYNPNVVVTDNKGNTGTINCTQVKVLEKPIIITGQCNARPTNGTEPLDVNLSFTTTGQVRQYTYTWIYDDGTTSTGNQSKIIHTYNKGTYNPKVKVSYQNNSETFNCPTITVNEIPPTFTLHCSAYPTNGYVPLGVNFEAHVTYNNGASEGIYPFVKYEWYFNDGTTNITAINSIIHTYNKVGEFIPYVRAYTAQGEVYKAECPTITVNNYPPLTATCNAQPTSGHKPLDVNFYSNANGGTGIYTYKWIFGDGITQTTSKNETTHTYYNKGTFNPKLKVTDSTGEYVIVNCPEIHVYKPIINHTLICEAQPTSGYKPLDVEFNAYMTSHSSEDGLDCDSTWTYNWNFNDGQTLTNGPNIWHTYTQTGIFNPTVTATNRCYTINASCPTITVNEIPPTPLNATCDAYPTSGYKPLTVNFTGTASGGSGTYYYYWYFDDGYSQYGQNKTTHKYNNAGIYHPTLKVTDTQNNIITVNCPTINVNNYSAITGICHAEPNNGYAPLTTELTVIVNGGSGTYTNYTWTFNDGTSQNTIINNVFHTYQNPGHYNPNVVVTDNKGNTGTINCTTINVLQQPIINHTLTCEAQPTNGHEPLEVNLKAQITTIIDYAETDSTSQWTYKWVFGDGNTLFDGWNVWHIYKVGTFYPKVYAMNGSITLTADCPTINVEYFNHTLVADPNGPYKDYVNTWILFDGSGSKGEIVKYVWDFGDGKTAETNTPYIYHLYNNTIGVFNVKLTVYDIYGFSAVGYTTATIIETTNFTPDDDRIKDGLWIGRIIMTGYEGIQEVIRSNDDLYINLELANDYEYDLDDARIIIEIPELGIKQKSTAFDLRTGQEKSQSITVPIWDAPQGWYQVKIIVQDDNVRRVKYRDLLVSNTYREGCIICSSGLY